MSAPPQQSWLWRGIGLLLVCSALGWVGCGGPRERYKVLSFFFDGVPNPDAPKKTRAVAGATTGRAALDIVSRHKPVVDGQCAACHRSSAGQIQEFADAYKACVTCHKAVSTQFVRMHGPVSHAQCQWCHTGHESPEKALLRDTPIKVCTQCHDQQLLGNIPPQHNDGVTSCVICHAGHGGAERYFLKPAAHGEWPSLTRPAGTQPGTQPESQPGSTPPATGASQRVQRPNWLPQPYAWLPSAPSQLPVSQPGPHDVPHPHGGEGIGP